MTTIISPSQQTKEKVFEKSITKKKKQKIANDEFRILNMSEYEQIKIMNYSVAQLKETCGFYKLKKSGNKNELIDKIYNHLKYSVYVLKIQKIIRGNFVRKYILLAGPAFNLKNRKLCVNNTDFATLEPLNEIPYNQFFSFSDSDGTIYGCDIASLFEILCKKSKYDIHIKKPPLI